MRNKIYKFLAILVVAGAFTSCEDEELGTSGEVEQQMGEYFLEAQGVASYLYNLVDKATKDPLLASVDSAVVAGVPVYAKNRTANTVTYLVDYGNGIVGQDGITRKGKLSIYMDGNFQSQSNAYCSITFNKFFVDNKGIGDSTNTDQVQFNATPSADRFEVVITNLNFHNEFTYSCNQYIEWKGGQSTPNENDDSFDFGSNDTLAFEAVQISSGNSISGSMPEALVYDRDCEYGVLSGIVDFTFAGDSIGATGGIIDFRKEDGCKNSVILTINTDNGGQIVLPKTFNGF